jgi:alkylresorcinol/alkylpyrone synthase
MSLETRHHISTNAPHRRDAPLPGSPRQAPRLAGVAVLDSADPGTSQEEALERLGLAGDEFARGIFARCGVHERDLTLDAEFLASNLQGRTARVEQRLLADATSVVDQLEVDAARVGCVISSSLYSIGCPSLAHRLIEHYGLHPETDKYHLTAVGCASAVPLLRLGTQIAQADPSCEVLILAAEAMSSILVPSREGDPRVKTVGSSLFGDGCAAALLSARPDATGPAVLATSVHQIPGTLEAVELSCEEQDSHLDLARELPRIAAEELPELVARFLAANHVRDADIAHWMLHPGGRRVVEEARDALKLNDEDIAVSWHALAEHGNVGTPSIFYVIDSTVKRRSPQAGELGLAVTIGPGVTVGLMLLGF